MSGAGAANSDKEKDKTALEAFREGADFYERKIRKTQKELINEIKSLFVSQEDKLDTIVKNHSTSFLGNIVIGVLSSFVFAGLVVGGYFVYEAFGNPLMPNNKNDTTKSTPAIDTTKTSQNHNPQK